MGVDDFSEIPLAGVEPTATALSMAIARFYWRSEEGSYNQANLGGILCFIVDRARKSRFLRLYDLNSFEILF